MSEEDKQLLEMMSLAIAISFEEMAIVLGRTVDEFTEAINNPESDEYKIHRKAYLLRKTKILNCIMDAAERDAPEAQKTALKMFDQMETAWQRNSR